MQQAKATLQSRFRASGRTGFSWETWALGRLGFSNCSSQDPEQRVRSCGTRASLLRGIRDLSRPGMQPVSPALSHDRSTAGYFLITSSVSGQSQGESALLNKACLAETCYLQHKVSQVTLDISIQGENHITARSLAALELVHVTSGHAPLARALLVRMLIRAKRARECNPPTCPGRRRARLYGTHHSLRYLQFFW